MNLKNKIGRFGQQLAANYFLAHGYKVLAENFYTQAGEIDLILEKDNQLIFVEVKTRLSEKFGLPEEAIDANKKEKLYSAGLKYLELNNVENDNFRFDCLAVLINKEEKKALIRHHKNIY